MWVNLFLGICLPIAQPVSVAAALFNAYRRRWLALVVIILLSPPVYFIASAGLDYARGTGRIRKFGLLATRSYSVDRGSRCGTRSMGCLANGSEWMTAGLYNSTLATAIEYFGPMKGSYQGAYPTQAECEAALRGSLSVLPADLYADFVYVGGKRVTLDAGVGLQLLKMSAWDWPEVLSGMKAPNQVADPGIRVAEVQGCLVMNMPDGLGASMDGSRRGYIVVLDTVVGRPFAYFEVGGASTYYAGADKRW